MKNNVIERHQLPMVAINLLTHNRTDLAVRTIHQCLRHLKYDGVLKWFVTDHDSEIGHFEKICKTIPNAYFLNGYIGRETIGACWNSGLKEIFQYTDYYIRLEDDMCLKADLDITRYVKVMMAYPEIGMVRLGQMCEGLKTVAIKYKIHTHIGYEEDILMLVNRFNQYAFSGHPALIHKRFHESHGLYSEKPISAGELEVDMDSALKIDLGREDSVSCIYFPWDLGRFGTWGAWDHVGKEKA